MAWTGAPPDVAIDLHGRGPASHRLLAALGPQRLITFGGRHGGGFAGREWRAGEHEVARWCRLCSESGIPADPADLRLTAVPRSQLGALPPAPGGQGLTLIHPGAAPPSRRWPPGRFAAVVAELARLGHQAVVTGSVAERPLTMDVARWAGLPPQSVLAGQTSLATLAALTASARLVVSGDTGLAHLATAYARPSVILFGPVPSAEWGHQLTRRHQALWTGGDGYRGDPHGRRTDPALAAIGVSDVLRAAERALAARPSLSPARHSPARFRGAAFVVTALGDGPRETADDACGGAAGG